MTMSDRTEASATSKVGPKRSRLRFEHLPAAYVHPERLGECLPPNLPVRFRDQLLDSPRLQQRLSQALKRRFAIKPCAFEDLDTPEGRFAQAEGDALQGAIRRIGAIWHGRTIRAIILASTLKQLIAWLGRDVHREALCNVNLAGAELDETILGNDPDIGILCQSIESDGQRCLDMWCRQQPAFLAARLSLKLPPIEDIGVERSAAFRDQGVLIADRVIMSMAVDNDSSS